ncbi:MAG: archaeosortase/exosortase family protein, partial [Proteobacteria bacterium]|nr:archaeosortase/exosortase family protein [Pseudomonadota bacterium]
VMALLTVSLIVVFSIELKTYNKIILLISSVIVAIILNVFRVTSTGVLAHFYDRSAATGFFHTFSGLVVFTLGLFIIYALGNLLKKLEKE